jgi:hypothetical protein
MLRQSTVYSVPRGSLRSGKVVVKKIEAVLHPFKLDDVRDVLFENNVHEFIVTEINAHEEERAHAEVRTSQMPRWRAPPDGKNLDRRNRLSLKHRHACAHPTVGIAV